MSSAKLLQARVEMDMLEPDSSRKFELMAERDAFKVILQGKKTPDDAEWQLNVTVQAPQLKQGKSTTTLFGNTRSLQLQVDRTITDFLDRYAVKFHENVSPWYQVIFELQDQLAQVSEDFPTT